MDIQSTPMRTTLSFTLSILFHVSLVAGGAVLGAFFANNHQNSPAKGTQSYEVTVTPATSAPEIADVATPAPSPQPPVVATQPAQPKPKVAQAPAVKKTPVKKIVVTDFSAAQPEPQAVVEVNETMNEPTDAQQDTVVAQTEEETLVKSEDIKDEPAPTAVTSLEEVAEQKAIESKSEQPAAPAFGSPEGTAAAGSATATPATKEAPQNFLTLKQAPNNRPPSYPKELRHQQVQGKGQLKYYVNKDGRVGQMELTQSTGSNELDKAALDAFAKYKFVPGQEGYTVHNFEFSLKGPAEPETRRLRTTYNK